MLDEADYSSGETFAKSLTPEMYGFLFAVPALFGLGDFWYLEDDEEKECSDVSWMVVSSLPKAKRKSFERWAGQYLPILMYCLVVGTILGKRVKQTYEEMKARQPRATVHQLRRNNNGQGETNVDAGEADSGNRPDAGETGQTSDSILGKSRILSDPISQAFS